jgi:hypothetical protein
MIKRFGCRLAAAAVFLLLFSLRFVDATMDEKIWTDPLESGWKSSGLVLEEVDTETWMKLADRWMKLSELQKVAQRMTELFGLRLKTGFITGNQGDYNYLSFTGTGFNRTEVTVTLQSCRGLNRNETQLGMYTTRLRPTENLRPYLNHLKTAIGSLGKNSHTTVILAGNWKGRLNRGETQELSRKIFRKFDAELVEVAYQSPENSVYKAYTQILPPHPQGALRSNIELQIGYDPDDKVTRIRLATPGNEDGV